MFWTAAITVLVLVVLEVLYRTAVAEQDLTGDAAGDAADDSADDSAESATPA